MFSGRRRAGSNLLNSTKLSWIEKDEDTELVKQNVCNKFIPNPTVSKTSRSEVPNLTTKPKLSVYKT